MDIKLPHGAFLRDEIIKNQPQSEAKSIHVASKFRYRLKYYMMLWKTPCETKTLWNRFGTDLTVTEVKSVAPGASQHTTSIHVMW